MVILGIDPGTALTGFGVVDISEGRPAHRDHGVIRTPSNRALSARLKMLDDQLQQLFDRYSPDALAVEQLFFNRNASSALSVGHARGVVLLKAAQHGAAVAEYTPLQVKQAVSGEGRADKDQVAFMVRVLLSLNQTPKPDDASDALAIAICHAHSVTMTDRLARAQERDAGGWVP